MPILGGALNYDNLSHVSVGEVRFIYFMKTCVTTWILKCKFGLKYPVFQRGNSNRGGLGAPNDCIMWNMCSKKQILPGIFYHLRKALTFLMTVPFMCNFRSSSDKFHKIFWSLIFHISLPRLGYFSLKKRKPKIFRFKNVMEFPTGWQNRYKFL